MSKFLGKMLLVMGCISGSMLMGMHFPVKNSPCTVIYYGYYIELVNKNTGEKQSCLSFSRPIVSAKWSKDRENTVKIKLENGGTGWLTVNKNVLKN